MNRNGCSAMAPIAFCFALLAGVCQPAAAATLCVNPGGAKGCFPTIAAAVAAASPGDTIEVSQGTYKEDVVIGKQLSLIGAGRSNTIIDATALSNGIYVNGLDNPGLNNVTVTGFTVENANFEGILVTNASFVTVWDNVVTHNDRSLNPATATCPGLPAFETAEGFDCGEAIHLAGADHSTVARNIVESNGGGILLTDETAAAHDNLITGNVSANNPFDCGIVLASHPPAAVTGSTSPLGVFRNTIAGNDSSYNGLGVHGAGAGVGIFTFLPGGTVARNVIINNRLTGNGLPGVAMHAHSPFENLNNNVVTGNYISGNGADTEDAATPGPAGINIFGVSPIGGTVISGNVIKDEANDIVANTPAAVEAHLNNLLGKQVGVNNIGAGSVNATENWWGCSGGPGAEGCATAEGAVVTPWLTKPF